MKVMAEINSGYGRPADEREIDLDEACALDDPEGNVTVRVSAKLYQRLLEELEELRNVVSAVRVAGWEHLHYAGGCLICQALERLERWESQNPVVEDGGLGN